MKEIYPLTTLRFFAAGLVFIAHINMIPGLEWINFGGYMGRAGVAIFFVLSGFILSYTYGTHDWTGNFGANMRQFYWSRFARIYPLHWLMFLIALPLGLNSHTLRVSIADFPWLLTLTDKLWPGAKFGPSPVFVSWTLSCEALFYLASPFIFRFLFPRKNPLLAASALLAGYAALIFIAVQSYPQGNWMAYLRVPEFLLGIIAFHLFQSIKLTRFTGLLSVSGVVLLIVAGWLDKNGWTRPWAFAPGALLLILGLANSSGSLKRFLSHPNLVLLGQASYAFYLLHDPVLRYARSGLIKLGVVIPPLLSIPAALALLGLVAFGSVVCFKFYENPIRLKLRSLFAVKTRQLNDDSTGNLVVKEPSASISAK